jgi:hypothetical protein
MIDCLSAKMGGLNIAHGTISHASTCPYFSRDEVTFSSTPFPDELP